MGGPCAGRPGSNQISPEGILQILSQVCSALNKPTTADPTSVLFSQFLRWRDHVSVTSERLLYLGHSLSYLAPLPAPQCCGKVAGASGVLTEAVITSLGRGPGCGAASPLISARPACPARLPAPPSHTAPSYLSIPCWAEVAIGADYGAMNSGGGIKYKVRSEEIIHCGFFQYFLYHIRNTLCLIIYQIIFLLISVLPTTTLCSRPR